MQVMTSEQCPENVKALHANLVVSANNMLRSEGTTDPGWAPQYIIIGYRAENSGLCRNLEEWSVGPNFSGHGDTYVYYGEQWYVRGWYTGDDKPIEYDVALETALIHFTE